MTGENKGSSPQDIVDLKQKIGKNIEGIGYFSAVMTKNSIDITMIRKFENKDLEEIMKIWLDTNIQAYDFILENYRKNNFDSVKRMLPDAEIYVYE